MKLSVRLTMASIALLSAALSAGQTRRIATGDEAPAGVSDLPRGERWAVIVGINDYPHLPAKFQLRYAAADADGVRALLHDTFGFEHCTLLTNGQATKAAILKALYGLANSQVVQPNDCVLFYFSGHGQTVPNAQGGQTGYLVPCDARVCLSGPPNSGDYFWYCIGMDELARVARSIKALHILVVVDACFSGLALDSTRGLAPGIPGYLDKPARTHSIQIITAGGAGEPSGEVDRLGHGAFTYKLIEGLKGGGADEDNDGVTTGSELAAYLRSSVPKVAQQTPQFRVEDEGEFLFITARAGNAPQPAVTTEVPPPPPPPPIPLWAVIVLVGLLVAALVALVVLPVPKAMWRRVGRGVAAAAGVALRKRRLGGGDRQAAQATAEEPTHSPRTPPSSIKGGDGAPMVLIPAGEFRMGCDDGGQPDEAPVHLVRLKAFYMSGCPVTNTQYARFLQEWGRNEDAEGNRLIDIDNRECLIEHAGDDYEPREGYGDHPVVSVSWHGARAYARHYGMRLPTEAEWERAARGGLEGQPYPWGTGLSRDLANYGAEPEQGVLEALQPIGQYKANAYGLYDMVGNVGEWCEDRYDEAYYGQSPHDSPHGPDQGGQRSIRGGTWSSEDPQFVRTAARDHDWPDKTSGSVGFRCVKDAEP